MEVRPAHIVILDISGYTRFIRLHKLSMLHAEYIINDLLESVIGSLSSPLVVNKLQGDSVLLYAPEESAASAAPDIVQQVVKAFAAFRTRERELVSDCALCPCDACGRIQNLRLKAIMHVGPVIFKRVQQFEEIAGQDVIMAHRLLKNTIPASEYILMSDSFDRLAGGLEGHRREPRQEPCDGFGRVPVVAYFPQHEGAEPRARKSLWKRFLMLLRMDRFLILRFFRRTKPRYENLAASQEPAQQ